MSKGIIYCLHNKITGKKYIGKTIKSLDIRIKEHIYNSKKYDTKFYNSLKKYGIENFVIGIIEEVDTNFLNDKEKYYISLYETYKLGYNSTIGGDGVVGSKHSENVKKLMSENRKGEKNGFYGRTHSEESKIKMSFAAKEKLLKNGHYFYGRTHSEESKGKMRKSNRLCKSVIIDGIEYESINYASKSTGLSRYKIRNFYINNNK